MQLSQQVDIHICNQNHFGVWGCFGFYSIIWEGEITRSENGTLGVLYVHIVNFWKVSNASRNGYVTFVFYGSCLCTKPYTGITVLGICKKWDKKNIHSFI